MATQGGVSQDCYENWIPHYAEAELERLYGSLFSSLAHFRVYGGCFSPSTYVAWRGGEIVALLLFRRERGGIRVINEWIDLNQDALERFTGFIFARYPDVSQIRFHAVRPGIVRSGLHVRQFVFTENIVVALPSCPEEYTAQLGSATRKTIRRHLNRLRRDFSAFEFRVFEREEIEESHVRGIVSFNRARMASKNKVSVISDDEISRLTALAKTRGLLMGVFLDGRLCAGTVAFRIGENIVSRLNAHDPAYDDYRLGTLSCYLSICESIRRSAREFQMMWGRYDYKASLLGMPRPLEDVLIYRSRTGMLLDSAAAARLALASASREVKIQLAGRIQREENFAYRFLNRSIQAARSLRQPRSA